MYLTHNNVFYFWAANQSLLCKYERYKAVSHRRQIYPTCVTVLLVLYVFHSVTKNILHFEWK